MSGPDDYGCRKEVLTRRYIHGMEESKELKEKDTNQHRYEEEIYTKSK